MNTLISQQYPILEMTLALRYEMLSLLTDTDLKFALPGNMTLGALCCQAGEFDRSYIEAFRSFRQEWTYIHTDRSIEGDVGKLRDWYEGMETELKSVISGLTEEQVQSQMIDRRTGFDFPVGIVFHIYRESLLIFYAKAGLYLRALGKPLSPQWNMMIG